jgi:hypothetical protein
MTDLRITPIDADHWFASCEHMDHPIASKKCRRAAIYGLTACDGCCGVKSAKK